MIQIVASGEWAGNCENRSMAVPMLIFFAEGPAVAHGVRHAAGLTAYCAGMVTSGRLGMLPVTTIMVAIKTVSP